MPEGLRAYYGSKWTIAPWIVEHLPHGHTFCMPFGGGGSPLWHINAGRYQVEVLNDINIDVITFFRVLREKPHDLAVAVELTPHSRMEFEDKSEPTSDLERARRFAVKAWQSYNGSLTSCWSACIRHARNGMASSASDWTKIPDRLIKIAERLRSVQIECLDALDCISRYDTPATVFYLDPPYVGSTRVNRGAYVHEYTDDQHKKLLERLQRIQGSALLSGYRCPLYDTLPWRRLDWEISCASAKETRTESLWIKDH